MHRLAMESWHAQLNCLGALLAPGGRTKSSSKFDVTVSELQSQLLHIPSCTKSASCQSPSKNA